MASFSVLNNIAAANAQANLAATNIGLNKALNRLSSGFRINSSGDDAAMILRGLHYQNHAVNLPTNNRCVACSHYRRTVDEDLIVLRFRPSNDFSEALMAQQFGRILGFRSAR